MLFCLRAMLVHVASLFLILPVNGQGWGFNYHSDINLWNQRFAERINHMNEASSQRINQANVLAEHRIGQMNQLTAERIDQVNNRIAEQIDQVNNRIAERINQVNAVAEHRIGQINQLTAESIDQVNNRIAERINQVNVVAEQRIEQLTIAANNIISDRINQIYEKTVRISVITLSLGCLIAIIAIFSHIVFCGSLAGFSWSRFLKNLALTFIVCLMLLFIVWWLTIISGGTSTGLPSQNAIILGENNTERTNAETPIVQSSNNSNFCETPEDAPMLFSQRCQQVTNTNPITSLAPGFITGGTVNCPSNIFAVSGSCNFEASNLGASHIPVLAASFNTNGGISWQCNYYNPSDGTLNMNVIVSAFCCKKSLSTPPFSQQSFRHAHFGGGPAFTNLANGASRYFVTTLQGTALNADVTMPFAGSIVGLSVRLDATPGLGCKVEVTKNGSPFGAALPIFNSVSGNTFKSGTFPNGTYTFAAGDVLTMYFTNVSGSTFTSCIGLGHFWVETVM